MIAQKKVLLLGSGLMAQAVVKKLCQRQEVTNLIDIQNVVTIASNIVADAIKIAQKYNNCKGCEVDVTDSNSLGPLVSASDVVISYVPAVMHIPIAKQCLKHKKNLVTASYVSPQMKQLHEQAAKNNLIFLNQLGLDPGIDHMSTMKVVDEVQANGGKIIEYESWCGGLPSPQFCDNPLGYRFTWSPIGALRSVKNNAKFIKEGKQFVVPEKQLLYTTQLIEINAALTLQGYPNRNSVDYQKFYRLQDASKVCRGTLRYRGFCTLMSAMKQLNMLSDDKVVGIGWRQQLSKTVQAEAVSDVQEGLCLQKDDKELLGRIISRTVNKVPSYEKVEGEEKKKKIQKIIKGLRFFGLLDPNNKFDDPSKSLLENLVSELNKKLKLNAGEADLIAMQHVFKIQPKEGRPFRRTSTLIMIGEKNGLSAMSKTVGYPSAIGAQLILDGKIKGVGILIPTEKEVYQPVLAELEKDGIRLIEADE